MRLAVDLKKKAGDFSLELCLQSDARRIGILGASGSGKSMALRCIAGIEKLDGGHIEVDGRVLYDETARIDLKPQQRRVGYMFQSYALFPTMSVLENVMAGLSGARYRSSNKNETGDGNKNGKVKNVNETGDGNKKGSGYARGSKSLSKREKRRIAQEMISRFQLEGLEDRLPDKLSGGQRQRVALARMMVTEPALILLDEPFSALDGHLRDRMQVELMQMLEDYPGQTIMVSHSRDELYRFSEEIFVISDGKLLRHGPTQEVFHDPRSKEAAILTGCKNYFTACRSDENDAHTLYLPGWDTRLRLQREVPADVTCLGYRAHYFIPVWGAPKENCIPFRLERVDELPFEHNYYLLPPNKNDELQNSTGELARLLSDKPLSSSDEPPICWIVQEDMQKQIQKQGLPDYLQLQEEAMMLLQS